MIFKRLICDRHLDSKLLNSTHILPFYVELLNLNEDCSNLGNFAFGNFHEYLDAFYA